MMQRLNTSCQETPKAGLAEAGLRGGDAADHAQAGARRVRGGDSGYAYGRHDRQAVDPLDDRLELLALGGGDRELELEDAEAGLGGADEGVGVREPREQRQVE